MLFRSPARAQRQAAEVLVAHGFHGREKVGHRLRLSGRHSRSARYGDIQDRRHLHRGRKVEIHGHTLVLARVVPLHRERRPVEIQAARQGNRPVDGRGRGAAVHVEPQRPQDHRNGRRASVRGDTVSTGARIRRLMPLGTHLDPQGMLDRERQRRATGRLQTPQTLQHGRRQARPRRLPRRHELCSGLGAGKLQGYPIPLHVGVLDSDYIHTDIPRRKIGGEYLFLYHHFNTVL